ncbi:MAG: ribonuclease H-like domain-containing protein [Methylococcales bacterium]|nr:ribonuclease H-like domain-containing protein [Methylococcales bacterium]
MFNQAKAVQFLPPAKFIALDIETGNAPADAIENAVTNWKAPKNWKPETVQAKREEHAQAKREKAALLDASPILCIACKTDTQNAIFSSMGVELTPINHWKVHAHKNERDMLQAFRSWANSIINFETLITGHNLVNFDLPKIRNAFIRHRLQLPLFLLPALQGEFKNEIIDTMKLAKAYTMEHRDDFLISLDTLADVLNIERPKQAMSGAEVPAAFERGEIAPILIYCCIDTETTAQAAQLMLGTAANLN